MATLTLGHCTVRPKGQSTCIHHKKQLELYCLDCRELACVGCVTSLHKRHDFCNLKDKTPKIASDIKFFINSIGKKEVANIQQEIISAKDVLKKEIAYFDDLEKEVINHLQKLKQHLDLLSNNIRSSYQALRKKNIEIVTDHIKDLETRQAEFNWLLSECKKVLQKGSHVDIYDFREEIHNLKPLPDKPTLDTATFSPNKEALDHLTKSFGTVTLRQGHLGVSDSSHQLSSAQQPTSTTKKNRHVTFKFNHLNDTRVITEFKPPCGIDAISATSDGEVYTKCIKEVARLNKKGDVQQKIQYEVRISDVSVSPTTQHIWTCSYEGSVMECIPPKSPEVRFKCYTKLRCICVTVDNCVLIGMSGHIIKYTTQGKIQLTAAQEVVRSPRRITECSVTHNVAVVDLDNKGEGGDGKPHVLVMDRNLQEIYRYRGAIPTKYGRTVKRREAIFNPYDVKYDSVGNLVISDSDRGCVHLLSGGGGGDYLTLIYTGDTDVESVGIDVKNVLWIYTLDGVKLLKYCNNDV